MSETKLKSESLALLYEQAKEKELSDLIRQIVEEKFYQLLSTETESKTLLEANEVCKKYRISKSTLERYVRNGLKYISPSPSKRGKRLFKQKDLDAFFENKNTHKQKNRNNGR
ncbi:MAG TPA: helix-turn-helix domain-containing protein [Flavobacterium sp.]